MTIILVTWAGQAMAAPLATLTEEIPAKIQDLLNTGDVARAYQIGLENSAAYAGDPDFDFYFGLAAIEAGHPEQAVFALERVLIMQPLNDRVRLELARATFLFGDLLTAREHFETVLAHDPPPNVRIRIEGFLDKIVQSKKRSRISGFAELSLGVDSNINSATRDTSFDSPVLGLQPLNEISQETEDSFSALQAGVDFDYLISKKTGFFTSLHLKNQDNFDSNEFDTLMTSLNTGLAVNQGKNRIKFPLTIQQLRVERSTFRNMLAIGTEWSRQTSHHDRIGLFGQIGALEYPDEGTRDVDLALMSLTWSHNTKNGQKNLAGSVYYGNEDAQEDSGEHNSRDYVGFRVGLQHALSSKQSTSTYIGMQSVKHAAVNALISTEIREDEFYLLGATWLSQLSKRLVLKIQLDYYNNQSNILLYEYQRTVLMGTIRYGW